MGITAFKSGVTEFSITDGNTDHTPFKIEKTGGNFASSGIIIETNGNVSFTGNIIGGDIDLSNEDRDPNEVDGTRGSWSIQEGAENVFMINRNTGKKYKILLDEVE